MLFFRRVMRKLGGKRLWFPQLITLGKLPQLITLGKPADTEELAKRLSAMSTVSKGDVFAVLSDLPDVMADILSNGRAVHLDGLGSFYLACTSRGNGVATKEEVDASQIKGLKVVFLPERYRGGDRQMKRPLVRQDMEFIEWEKSQENSIDFSQTDGAKTE